MFFAFFVVKIGVHLTLSQCFFAAKPRGWLSAFLSLSLSRAPTVWVHVVSPCAGCLDVFHSNRTLVLALDTDPGVDPNQKQGARPVLRHIKLAKTQNGYVSA